MGSPPVDTYEVTHNLERFRPLHLIADALVEYLVDVFDATAEQIEPVAGDSRFFGGVERVVRVVPNGERRASLTFTYTGLPGISIATGRWHEFPFPVCGCDACDETWENIADEMESVVSSVVSGGYSESVDHSEELPLSFMLEGPQGTWRAGRGGFDEGDQGNALADVVERWLAWPLR